jgi:hypothetical protein
LEGTDAGRVSGERSAERSLETERVGAVGASTDSGEVGGSVQPTTRSAAARRDRDAMVLLCIFYRPGVSREPKGTPARGAS